MIIRDFRCNSCEKVKEELVQSHTKNIKCECGSLMRVHYTALKTSGIDSFNPHYDLQMGTYFESKEQKQRFLTEKGFTQIGGNLSPKKNTGVETLCSKDQFKNNGKQL